MVRLARSAILAVLLPALGAPGTPPLQGQVAVVAPSAPAARGWLGVSFEMQTTQTGSSRVTVTRVTDVLEGSPAALAGVRVGDVVLSFNGRDVRQQFATLARTLRPGDPVRMTVQRDGRTQDIRLTAGTRPAEASAPPSWTFEVQADSVVDRLYMAMDSLRIRITENDGRGFRIATQRMAADSIAWSVGPDREMVVRLRTPGAPPAVAAAPFDVRTPEGLRVVVTPEEVRAPFGFYLFQGDAHDSLQAEMGTLNREMRSLRSQEAARIRELARQARGSQARIDETDRELLEVRESLAAVTARASDLRAAMEQAARAEAGLQQERALSRITSGDVAPDVAFRPLDPYLLGQNRAAGAEVIDLQPELAAYFQVEGGVLIVDVPEGTPAHTAGLQPGDVLTHVAGQPLASISELRRGLAQAGRALPLTLVRKGRTMQVLLRR